MTHKEKALQLFSEGYLCSQSVLAAYSDLCGITERQALKLGSCLGTGMRKGEVCGAVTGALLVLGLLYGQDDSTDRESRIRSNTVNDAMMERFRKRCGSYLCNELLQCDITMQEGLEHAVNNRLFKEFCPEMVSCAADVLEQIMAEMGFPQRPV